MARKRLEIPKESCAMRLKTAMSIRNISQVELCKQTGIPKSAMSEYLKGLYEPKQDRLILLSEALSVDSVWLMGFDVSIDGENKKISPGEEGLTEGEAELLELFRLIPVDQQPVVLAMIRAALGSGK